MSNKVEQAIDDVMSEFENNDTGTNEATEETVQEVATEDVAVAETPEVEEIHIPENWEAGLKDFIGGIEDKEHQKSVFDKFKSFDDGYQQKFQSLADERKTFKKEQDSFMQRQNIFNDYEALNNAFKPEEIQYINSNYGSTPAYFKSLAEMDRMASTDPVSFINNYCSSLGITPEQLTSHLNGAQYQQANQQYTMQSNNQNMESKFEKMLNERFSELEAQNEYNQLLATKDESGNLRYPHLDKVIDMTTMLTEQGQPFDQAYENAVYANPELRQSLIQQSSQVQQHVAETQRAKTVKPVKSTTSSSKVKYDKMKSDDIINSVLDEQGVI